MNVDDAWDDEDDARQFAAKELFGAEAASGHRVAERTQELLQKVKDAQDYESALAAARQRIAEQDQIIASWKQEEEVWHRRERELMEQLSAVTADWKEEQQHAMAAEKERDAANLALVGAEKDGARYRIWRKEWRDGDCNSYNALCNAQTDGEHDAAIDALLAQGRAK